MKILSNKKMFCCSRPVKKDMDIDILRNELIYLKDQIKGVYDKLLGIFSESEEKYPFSELAGNTPESRVSTFIPLLHLDNQQKVWLEQEQHFEEICLKPYSR